MVTIRRFSNEVAPQVQSPTLARGADQYRGGEYIAQGLQDIGDEALVWADEIDTADAKSADAAFNERVNNLLYADQTGYMYQTGSNAVNSRGSVTSALDQAREEILGKLSPSARRKAETAFQARYEGAAQRINQHVAGERRTYLNNAADAQNKAYLNEALADPTTLNANLTRTLTNVRDTAAREGWSPEVTAMKEQEARDAFYVSTIERMVEVDPGAALDFAKENKENLSGTALADVERRLVPLARERRGRQAGRAAATAAIADMTPEVVHSMYDAGFSDQSVIKAKGADPRIALVLAETRRRTGINMQVSEGLRTQERQDQLYAQGRTAPGEMVTWTRNSRHTHGSAMDVVLIGEDGKADWDSLAAYDQFGQAAMEVAREMGVPLEWGGQWGTPDRPHFQVADGSHEPAQPGEVRLATAGDDHAAFQLPDGTVVRREGGTRAWRNNNPGNLIDGKFAQDHGAIGTDGRFAIFPDYETGRAAKEALLFADPRYEGLSIEDALHKYAPPVENDSGRYVDVVVNGIGGVTGDTPLSDLTPDQRAKMLDTMAVHEGFEEGTETVEGGSPSPLRQIAAIENPDERQVALQEYNLHLDISKQETEAARTEALNAGFAMIEQGGSVSDLDPQTLSILGPQTTTQLRELEAAKRRGEVIETDWQFYTDLHRMAADDPEAFMKADPMGWRMRLSDADFKRFQTMQQQMKIEGPDAAKPVSASTIMTLAKRQMEAAGIDTTPDPGSNDARSVSRAQSRLVRWQDAFIAENGREPTQTEMMDRVNRELVEVVVNPPGINNEYSGGLVGAEEVAPTDLAKTDITIGDVKVPSGVVAEQIAAMEAAGQAVTSEALLDRLTNLLIQAGRL